ncbi:hypothetical protein SAMN05443579_116125 [Variovorax sp. PDC80]|uniref:DUF5329 family protein n=1 Tax=Variovorax sp. PDC80 TaxID=1882827 RepID=UPI0008E4742F|nr:DUF5329 family protein [Variovorax sp. PDC80]SFP85527.1 hypothetical protein SAMN05443579_116125 [Variovorax sp. PDC80]
MTSFQPLRRALLAALLGTAAAFAHATPSESEHRLIDTLIQRVAKMGSMTFLRNGSEYNATEAAKHMQAKYEHFKKEIVTAEDFIERCATRSEMTGQAYRVKLGGGAIKESGEFLRAELHSLREEAKKGGAKAG